MELATEDVKDLAKDLVTRLVRVDVVLSPHNARYQSVIAAIVLSGTPTIVKAAQKHVSLNRM